LGLPISDLDFDCRISANETPGQYIIKYHAARRDDGAAADLHSRRDETQGRDPGPIAHRDRSRLQLEIFPSKIVAPRAKIGALTNANIRSDRNLREAENADLFPDPDVIAHRQPPGMGNI